MFPKSSKKIPINFHKFLQISVDSKIPYGNFTFTTLKRPWNVVALQACLDSPGPDHPTEFHGHWVTPCPNNSTRKFISSPPLPCTHDDHCNLATLLSSGGGGAQRLRFHYWLMGLTTIIFCQLWTPMSTVITAFMLSLHRSLHSGYNFMQPFSRKYSSEKCCW